MHRGSTMFSFEWKVQS